MPAIAKTQTHWNVFDANTKACLQFRHLQEENRAGFVVDGTRRFTTIEPAPRIFNWTLVS
jgi:hypothetical protein